MSTGDNKHEHPEGTKNVTEERIRRPFEAWRVPLEKAAGRGPVGPPPRKVNPAPETQASAAATQGKAPSK